MRKLAQNRIAESRYTLPVAAVYALCVWLLAGGIQQGWWVQAGCFLLAVLLMIRINNENVLIRIYSRMISTSFIFLSCAATGLLASASGAVTQLCIIAALYILFKTYQDKRATGASLYSFLLLGGASMVTPHVLFLLPVFWLMMGLTLYSLSWRTFLASLTGLICPYWFATAWLLAREGGGFTSWAQRFAELGRFGLPFDITGWSLAQLLMAVLIGLVGTTAVVHFIRNSYLDKIRVRQIYYSLMLTGGIATALLVLQPRHYDLLMRVMIVTASPFAGHFLALSHGRLSNITFFIITAATVALTIFSLWTTSSVF